MFGIAIFYNGCRNPIAQKESLLPVAAILMAVLLWGGSFAAMRVAVKALNPWAVMWFRMMAAVVILLGCTIGE